MDENLDDDDNLIISNSSSLKESIIRDKFDLHSDLGLTFQTHCLMEALRLDPPVPVSQIMCTTEEISTRPKDGKEEPKIAPDAINPKSKMK